MYWETQNYSFKPVSCQKLRGNMDATLKAPPNAQFVANSGLLFSPPSLTEHLSQQPISWLRVASDWMEPFPSPGKLKGWYSRGTEWGEEILWQIKHVPWDSHRRPPNGPELTWTFTLSSICHKATKCNLICICLSMLRLNSYRENIWFRGRKEMTDQYLGRGKRADCAQQGW